MSWIIKPIIDELLNQGIEPIKEYDDDSFDNILLLIAEKFLNWLSIRKHNGILIKSRRYFKYYKITRNINLNEIEQIILSIIHNVHFNSNTRTKSNVMSFIVKKKKEFIDVQLTDFNTIQSASEYFANCHTVKSFEYPYLVNQNDLTDNYAILIFV